MQKWNIVEALSGTKVAEMEESVVDAAGGIQVVNGACTRPTQSYVVLIDARSSLNNAPCRRLAGSYMWSEMFHLTLVSLPFSPRMSSPNGSPLGSTCVRFGSTLLSLWRL